MHMRVPTVVCSATLDFAEIHSSTLRGGPALETTHSCEAAVQPVDVLLHRCSRLAKGQRDQAKLPILREDRYAVRYMTGPVSRARRTEPISALVAGHSVVGWIVYRLQHPSVFTATIKASKTSLSTFERFKCSPNSISIGKPSAMPERYSRISLDLVRIGLSPRRSGGVAQKAGRCEGLSSCFEGSKLRRGERAERRRVGLCIQVRPQNTGQKDQKVSCSR